ncbi:MAG: CopG family transcriptional regulator [Longimicrobiales bacterium]
MSTVKTTVYLDADDYRRLKGVATSEGRPTAELIRIAVSEFVERKSRRPLPTSLGAARGGPALAGLSEEEMLEGFGDS